MSDENMEHLDAEVQDDNTSIDVDNNDTSGEGENPSDERYLNQKKRAEKAEAEKKEALERQRALEQRVKELESGSQKENKTSQDLSRDEVVLLAQGMTEDEISKLHSVAKAEGVSLREAKDSDLFRAWYDTEQRKKKAEKAKLSGSGSGRTEAIKTSGLSAAEHKELWSKKMGR